LVEVVPDELRRIEVDGPGGGVALGADRVLLRSHLGDELAHAVVDIESGTTTSVDPLAGDEGPFTHLVPFGDDALAWTLQCPEYSEEDLEESRSTCVEGFTGVGIARFDGGRDAWMEVGTFPPSSLGAADPNQMSVSDVGVAGRVLYLRVSSAGSTDVVAVDMDAIEAEIVRPAPPDDVSVACVAGNGAIVGSRGTTRSRSIIVLAPGGGRWEELEDFEYSSRRQVVGCRDDGVVVVGRTDDESVETRWQELALDGAVRADRVLGGLPPADIPVTDTFYGQGTDDLGFVREMRPGTSTRTGPSLFDFELDFFRTVVLVSAPDRPPIVLHDADETEGSIGRPARLADGTVVVFDNTDGAPHLAVLE
jgi:hypothetical protein